MTDVFKITGEERDELMTNLYSSIRELLVEDNNLSDKWHELSETHKEITEIENKSNRTGKDIFENGARYYMCKEFDIEYNDIMKMVNK